MNEHPVDIATNALFAFLIGAGALATLGAVYTIAQPWAAPDAALPRFAAHVATAVFG